MGRSEEVKRLEEILEELEEERKQHTAKLEDLEIQINTDKKIIAFYYEQLNKCTSRIDAVKKAIKIINRYSNIVGLVDHALAEKGYFGNEFTTYLATRQTVVEEVLSSAEDTELPIDKGNSS
jgi:chromosome segregation ATPase